MYPELGGISKSSMWLNWPISSRGPYQRTQASWTSSPHRLHILCSDYFYFRPFPLIYIIIISHSMLLSVIPITIIVIKLKLKVTNFRQTFLFISGFLCFGVNMEDHAIIKKIIECFQRKVIFSFLCFWQNSQQNLWLIHLTIFYSFAWQSCM